MKENLVYMLGIELFVFDGYADVMEEGTQYKVSEWQLIDMEKYNGKYAVIGFDGSLKIYEEDGKELFDGSLLDSTDYVWKLKNKIKQIKQTFREENSMNEKLKQMMEKEKVEMLQRACSRLEGFSALLKTNLVSRNIKNNDKNHGIYYAVNVIEENVRIINSIISDEYGEYIEDFGQYMNVPE